MKSTHQRKHAAPWLRLLLGIVLAAVAVAAGQMKFAQAVEHRTHDLRARYASASYAPSTNIVIVAIDDESLSRLEPNLGRWPWRRAVFGAVLDYCSGASVIGMDILFTEADWQYAPSDDVFADEAGRLGRVVSAAYFDDALPASARAEELKGHVLNPDLATEATPPFRGSLLPYEALRKASARIGHVNYMPDEDGTLREYLPYVTSPAGTLPSLAMAMLMVAQRVEASDVVRSEDGTLRIGTNNLPLSSEGGFLVCPQSGPHETYAIADVIEAWKDESEGRTPSIERSLFDDKMVFIGSLATGLQGDRKVSSVSPLHAGVQITASALDNMLNAKYYRQPEVWVSPFLTFALCLLLALAPLGRPVYMIGGAVSLIAIYFFLVMGALLVARWMLPVTIPIAGILLTGSGIGSLYWYRERMQRRALESLEKAKQQFTDMLVHDMKGRVTPIMMSLSSLRKQVSAENEKAARYLLTARSSANRLLDQINALLDIRKMEEGRLPLRMSRVSMDELLEGMVAEFEATAEMIGMRITCRIDTPGLGLVALDTDIFSRIMGNLIWNAMDHGEAGSEVTVSAAKEHSGIRVIVSNHGKSIPGEDRERIFLPFVSDAGAEGSTRVSSTGLGLTFCKLAVEAHGGTIGIVSPLPDGQSGVCIELSIPAAL